MPIQLCVNTTGQLDDRVSADRIVEGGDDDVCTICLGSADRLVHVPHQIACAFQAEWIRDRRFEAEHGHRADRGQDQLRHSAALGWSYCEDSLPGRCTPKCRNQTRDETIEIFRSNVDVCGVVLRPYGHTWGFDCLRA